MQEEAKNKILNEAKEHIGYIQEKINEAIARKEIQTEKMSKDATSLTPGDKIAYANLIARNLENAENLRQLYPSPYFTRCDFEVDGQKKKMFISKFSFSDENIYSWITPIATLRFENTGPASYTRPDGSTRSGFLSRKDQYLISDGKLLFLSTESSGAPRELVYQEHFTRQKQGFILPEVVELMEKAQDQIVRAHYRGPFTISGPAGSGKTTLALHRVAYLLQSPETAEYFTPDKILVLVQDSGTKEYFSHLLPELGIRGVSIITFFEWATSILGLSDYHIANKLDMTQTEQKLFEYAKLQSLKNLPALEYGGDIYGMLKKGYENYLTAEQKTFFNFQKKNRLLDRFDLTILLEYYNQTHGEFTIKKEMYYQLANGTYRKKMFKIPANYNLMIIDEFQNYLPEQLAILKSCVNDRLESVIYVGDIAQQTYFGTVKSWAEIHHEIKPERFVTLQKVYRNTKEILQYITGLGYVVAIPKEIKNGKPVAEIITKNNTEEIKYIKNLAERQPGKTIGVLAHDYNYLKDFKAFFKGEKNIYCLSMQEAQGVEFDIVCIVGINKETFKYDAVPAEIRDEIKKIDRDLLYVALTRAISGLHVLGSEKLNKCLLTQSAL